MKQFSPRQGTFGSGITLLLVSLLLALTVSSTSTSFKMTPSFHLSHHINNATDLSSLVLSEDGQLFKIERDGEQVWCLNLGLTQDLLSVQQEQKEHILLEVNDRIVTVSNSYDNEIVIRTVNSDGFLVGESVLKLSAPVTSATKLHSSNVLFTLFSGDVVELDLSAGNAVQITKQYNLYFLKHLTSPSLKVQALSNGNVVFYFKDDAGTLSYIHYSHASDQEDEVHPFNFETLDYVKFSSIVELYGTKIITDQGQLVFVNAVDGSIRARHSIGSGLQSVSVDSDSIFITYSAESHQLSVHDTFDFSTLFPIDNILNYRLSATDSTLVLVTEHHIRVIDLESGLELTSYFLGPQPLEFSKISEWDVAINKDDLSVSLIVKYTNGAVAKYANDVKLWTLDTTFSDIVDSVFVNVLPVPLLTESEVRYEEDSNLISAYIFRLVKHFNELRAVYNAFWDYLPRFFEGDLKDIKGTDIARDLQFGFIQHFIFAGSNGVVKCVSTADLDNELWSFDVENTDTIIKLELTNDESTVFVFTSQGKLIMVDVHNGQVKEEKLIPGDIQTVRKITEDHFLLSLTSGFSLIYSTNDTPLSLDSAAYFISKDSSHSSINANEISPDGKQILKTWSFQTHHSSEKILKLVQSSSTATTEAAQLGHISPLSKSVTYKSLSPYLIAIATYDSSTSTLQILLRNIVTGETYKSSTHTDSTAQNFDFVMGEHYLIYTYFSTSIKTPGQRVVVWDMYESITPDVRLTKSDSSVSAFDMPSPQIKERVFILPNKVSSIALSKTKFGATSKAVLFHLSNGQILSLDKSILDARRPSLENVTAEDKMQNLLPYNSILPVSDSSIISQNNIMSTASGKSKIIVTPTELESTSLVLALSSAGLSVFRLTPSGLFDSINDKEFKYTGLVGCLVTLSAVCAGLWWAKGVKRVKAGWVDE